jgi:hypothetical protein
MLYDGSLQFKMGLERVPAGLEYGQTYLESGGISTNNGIKLLSILEEIEGGHGANTELRGNFGGLVNVNLVKVYVFVFGWELLNYGSHHLAGTYAMISDAWNQRQPQRLQHTAPCGKAVDDNELVGFNDLLELVQTGACQPEYNAKRCLSMNITISLHEYNNISPWIQQCFSMNTIFLLGNDSTSRFYWPYWQMSGETGGGMFGEGR